MVICTNRFNVGTNKLFYSIQIPTYYFLKRFYFRDSAAGTK